MSAEVKEETKQETTEKKEEGVKLPEKLAKILKAVEELSVIELAELVKGLEKRFGVSAAAAVAVAAPAGGAAQGGGAAAEEKTSFQVILASAGDKKIQVIKEIRALTNLGLKEAKDLVESAPKPIKDGVSKEDAAKIKAAVEAQGGKVEIK
ncbi:MAG: 50S ribosomal protein L7/L12 [Candidatus Omnitrophica bacterium CG11_big_fil_rev_8_21_14_0_20_45_26]|uniref:Large ribosomal subunit protein bL12 n=1 Tax=Candidatus Abzuiibacterium crystallinum TaxID=1974748 RepID=A0A2H0LQZ4_9BACT|nr:MAG: 50S ribosomal protein L7/L12 [Candidatus Omnitrophica bacterium CG11_big_fil_rev_8_21_14_0_20_45_26]PIW63429.1 MAG: 50S ribosomal protein L7/L12 [Candidatus Omnitrophica bacterium CG12_big_fil_rev_8_21_14_0_65_45_16]